MNYIPPEPVYQAPPTYLVTSQISDATSYFGVCPYAQTFTAYSYQLHTDVLCVLSCRRWSCSVCSQAKIRQLAHGVRRAEPNRLLTLTVDPALYADPKAAWEATRRSVPLLVRKLRTKFGSIEYLRVTEVTKAGWPHYHLLVRSGFLPHAVVKQIWRDLTGARIVDLRQVKRSFEAYTYLVKYLSKLHRLDWTERHVSVSRSFIPPDDQPSEDRLVLSAGTLHHFHPANYVAEHLEGRTLKRLSDACHVIVPQGGDPNAFT